MNIKDLKCFKQVYMDKGISRAAQKLYITPQGLGKTIHNLEKELGTVLFTRTSHGVEATVSGHYLASRADHLIEELEEIENRIRQFEIQKEKLRIGCANGIFQLIPFSTISSFMEKEPSIQVEWCEYSNGDVKKQLKDSQIEYGFIVGSWDDVNIIQKKLAVCRLHVLIYEGHPLYDSTEVCLNQLREEPLLLMNEQFHMYRDIMDACRSQGFAPQVAAKTADGTFLYRLCRQKLGLAIVPEFFTENLPLTDVHAIPLKDPLTWDVYGVYLKDNASFKGIAAFESFLSEYL